MDLAELLADDFHLYLIDLPGHGNTPLEDFQPSFQNFSDVLVEFVVAHVPAHPILLGHSMGGALSLLAGARQHPRAIINLDGAFPAGHFLHVYAVHQVAELLRRFVNFDK